MKKIRNIILIGPQGCGKSTQAGVISDYLEVSYLSMGNILRTAVKKKTNLGKKIEPIINSGRMISDEIAIDIVKDALLESEYKNGFILDGFPRNIVQAEAMDKYIKIDKVFEIEISDKVAIERISGRRICPNKHVWHIKFRPSKIKDKCDICNQELYQRKDDTKDSIKVRLNLYRKYTSKLLEYYSKQGKLVIFDGEKDIEEISKDLFNYLKKHA